MSVSVQVRVDDKALLRAVNKLKPGKNPVVFREFLDKLALQVQTRATKVEIIRGGTGPPHPTRLTSRTGAGRRSISVDRRGLPNSISIGSNLVYMAVHEFGGKHHKVRAWLAPAVAHSLKGAAALAAKIWERRQ